ncbi:MAG: hypothetical protein RLZZ188_2839 [Verrucomicrobiota bacterium]
MAQFSQSASLYLAHSLTGDAHVFTNLGQSSGETIHAKTRTEDFFFSLFESTQLFNEGSFFKRSCCGVKRRDCAFVGDDVA